MSVPIEIMTHQVLNILLKGQRFFAHFSIFQLKILKNFKSDLNNILTSYNAFHNFNTNEVDFCELLHFYSDYEFNSKTEVLSDFNLEYRC